MSLFEVVLLSGAPRGWPKTPPGVPKDTPGVPWTPWRPPRADFECPRAPLGLQFRFHFEVFLVCVFYIFFMFVLYIFVANLECILVPFSWTYVDQNL